MFSLALLPFRMFSRSLKDFCFFHNDVLVSYYFYNFIGLQDEGLDDIAEGLHTLKNMAHDMNEV